MRIPRIFHQFWTGSEFPSEYDAYRETWQANHPNWEFRLWTPDNLPYLQAQKQYDFAQDYSHSDWVETYKSNVVRFELLFQFGGVWIDCDIECLKPIDPLIEDCEAFVGVDITGVPHSAIMGCVPYHALAVDLCELVRNLTPNPTMLKMGMWALERVMRNHPEVTRFSPEYFHAFERVANEGCDTSKAYVHHHDHVVQPVKTVSLVPLEAESPNYVEHAARVHRHGSPIDHAERVHHQGPPVSLVTLDADLPDKEI